MIKRTYFSYGVVNFPDGTERWATSFKTVRSFFPKTYDVYMLMRKDMANSMKCSDNDLQVKQFNRV